MFYFKYKTPEFEYATVTMEPIISGDSYIQNKANKLVEHIRKLCEDSLAPFGWVDDPVELYYQQQQITVYLKKYRDLYREVQEKIKSHIFTDVDPGFGIIKKPERVKVFEGVVEPKEELFLVQDLIDNDWVDFEEAVEKIGDRQTFKTQDEIETAIGRELFSNKVNDTVLEILDEPGYFTTKTRNEIEESLKEEPSKIHEENDLVTVGIGALIIRLLMFL